jgi:hypothetical protein
LTRNIACHAKCSIIQPPAIGPIAMPIPATAAQAPMALGRSSSGKMLLITDSVVGMIPAAPTPIRARAAISSVALPANAAHREPAPNTASPASSARRRPKRSPRLPAARSNPANRSR